MRVEKTKQYTESITCDICKNIQEVEGKEIYWAHRYVECYWHVPPDGINHGKFKGDLCPSCRKAISDAIDKVIKDRSIVIESRW